MSLLNQRNSKKRSYKISVSGLVIQATVFWGALFLFLGNAVPAQDPVPQKKSADFTVAPKICHIFQDEDGDYQLVASDNQQQIILLNERKNLLFSYDINSGFENWRTEINNNSQKIFSSDGKNLFFAISVSTESDAIHYSLKSMSLNTGITNWQQKIDSPISLYIVPGSNFLVTIQEDKTLSTWDKNDGKLLWRKRFDNSAFSVNSGNEIYFTILTENQIQKVAAKNGEIIETTNFPISFTGSIESLAVNSKWLIFGDSLGEIRKKGYTKNNPDWTFKTGGRITSLTEVDGGILAISYDNFVYLFNPESGKQKWKKRVGDRIDIKPFVIGEYTVVASSNSNTVTIIDLDEGKTINQIRITNDGIINGKPLIFNRKLLIPTTKGIYVYAFGECK